MESNSRDKAPTPEKMGEFELRQAIWMAEKKLQIAKEEENKVDAIKKVRGTLDYGVAFENMVFYEITLNVLKDRYKEEAMKDVENKEEWHLIKEWIDDAMKEMENMHQGIENVSSDDEGMDL